jgi:hypothetical protein
MFILGIHRSIPEVAAVMIAEVQGGFAVVATYRGSASLKALRAEVEGWRREGGPLASISSQEFKAAGGDSSGRFEIAIPEDMLAEEKKILPMQMFRGYQDGPGMDWDTVESVGEVREEFVVARTDLPIASCRIAQALSDGELLGEPAARIKSMMQATDFSGVEKIGGGDNLVMAAAIAIHAAMEYRYQNAPCAEIDYATIGPAFLEILAESV